MRGKKRCTEVPQNVNGDGDGSYIACIPVATTFQILWHVTLKHEFLKILLSEISE